MATYFLDTSVIIDALNARNGRPALLERLLRESHLLACCPINVAEIYAGVRPKEEARTEAFLKSLELLALDWESAQLAGLFKRDWARRGVALSVADCVIAAAAVRHGCTLITDNAKHFPMRELTLYRLD